MPITIKRSFEKRGCFFNEKSVVELVDEECQIPR